VNYGTKNTKKRGRKALILTSDQIKQVEHLAALNMGVMDICRSLGISWSAFDKNRKKKQEINDALERGKAKGLQRATSKLMEKIEDGEFQAIQFYLKSADREKWAERAEINHSINLAHILEDAQARIIELPRAEAPHAPKVKRLENIKGKG
jgi:murein L,D-transpeptidase YcbB/YkuD